jgi:hypothetical protein
MVTRSPALNELRGFIITTGSAYLRNVRWVAGVTCRTCGGIPSVGHDQCYQCAVHADSAGAADTLGFVVYGWNGGQAGHAMYAYKAKGATTHALVSAVLTYATVAHWSCIAREPGSTPSSWAYVPSLSGRQGDHPLAGIARRFMGEVPHVHMKANPITDNPRSLNPSHYRADPVTGHVLLLDDTWTSGGHLQSAAAALKSAGADRVTGLVMARWLDPAWAGTKQFLESLIDDFDPDVCPYTGTHC